MKFRRYAELSHYGVVVTHTRMNKQLGAFTLLLIFGLFFLSLLSSSSATGQVEKKVIRVAVASNFLATAKLIETQFEQSYDIDVDIIAGSTGRLFAQILHGAPYDVFLAADDLRPRKLPNSLSSAISLKPYAVGQLTLWSRVGCENLIANKPRQVAIANPKLAPYGKASMQAMQAIGVLDSWQSRFVTAENVNQVHRFILSGAVDIAFLATSQSHVLADVGCTIIIESDLYDPIIQTAALLNNRVESKQFWEFLFSSQIHELIAESGYKVP